MSDAHESAVANLAADEEEQQLDSSMAPGVPDEATNGQAEDEDDSDDADDGDYDPESVAFEDTPQAPSKTASATPSQLPASSKPKTSGGFLVEVSDDEDDDDDGDDSNVPSAQPRASQQAPPVSGNNSLNVESTDTPPAAPSSIANLDPVVILEARVKEDPRGDMDAWLSLMADFRRRSKLDGLRSVYNRFLEIFPQAADVWVEWIELELGLDNFMEAERLFGRCLMSVLNVKLWTVYLNYIRRRNDLTNDSTGQARRTVAQSYDFVIDNICVDRDSGTIWTDFINFVKSGPGQIGGSGWQDQQKMDQLRKAYQRAITIPMLTVNNLWRDYDQFEMGLNKVTGRKFIQERSPGYMTAKGANIALENLTRGLKRSNLPRLPPAPGFDGYEEFQKQVTLWQKWIDWEKNDPLVLKNDEPHVFKQRVLYCYKQALMALRFCPEIWVDAAAWCLLNNVRDIENKPMGTELLLQGIVANPESVLLALKHADHVEVNFPEKESRKSGFAKAVRRPYDTLLDTLYKMGDKVKEREKLEVNTLKQAATLNPAVQHSIEPQDDEEDDDDDEDGKEAKRPKLTPTEQRIAAIQKAYSAESQLLSRTISYVWIAMARALRRIQGKGNQNEGGLRKVFTDARQRGRLTSDVYIAVAMLESVVYKDPVGSKIFERGARLFPNDANFMIEYIKFLHANDDTTNARVVFETCVNRLVSKAETLQKAKPLYAYFHKYESQYGELSQISKLEQRMAELFPEDPKLESFEARFSSEKFDPIAAPIIISKGAQMRPKQVVPVIEQPASARNSVAPLRIDQSPKQQQASQAPQVMASPKRPFNVDDEDLNPAKRLARGASPLKGAAGRRLDQQRRSQAPALHRDITFLLGILPPAHTYDTQRLKPTAMVSLLHDTPLPDFSSWRAMTGGQYRSPAPLLGRQPSAEYATASLTPQARLLSSFGGFRNSPLRTESGVMYQGGPFAPEATAAQPAWASAAYGLPAPQPSFPGYRFQ